MAELYPLDLPDNNTGYVHTFYFPVVDDPSDTPQTIALRQAQLESAAARMQEAEREDRGERDRRSSSTDD